MSSGLTTARVKAYCRLLPILIICYMIAYVDRNNVAIAKLNMVQDLKQFDERVFGFGIGVFFWGYMLLEVPGTVLVERWSANKWICRIMVTWGIIAALTAFVQTPMHFYIIRFLLGVAEAGFFPGVIVYLTHWFPQRDRSRVLAVFFIATPIAMMLSPIVSQTVLFYGSTEIINGQTIHYPKLWGLDGWQWVYIMWGIPAVLIGAMLPFILPDYPKDARWLKPEEREALERELEREKLSQHDHKHTSILHGLTNPRILMLTLIYFGAVAANYGVEGFLPTILKDWYQLTSTQAALLTIAPSILVLIGQLGIGWSSDHFQERRWHAAIPIALGSLAFLVAPFTQGNLWLTMICFMVAAAGIKAYMPAFWALPSLFMTNVAAAGSIGLINSFGNLGGFVGPMLLGSIKESTRSYDAGLYALAGLSGMSVLLLLALPLKTSKGKTSILKADNENAS
jgi:ACS family tartrate transporter-like MFS transporter